MGIEPPTWPLTPLANQQIPPEKGSRVCWTLTLFFLFSSSEAPVLPWVLPSTSFSTLCVFVFSSIACSSALSLFLGLPFWSMWSVSSFVVCLKWFKNACTHIWMNYMDVLGCFWCCMHETVGENWYSSLGENSRSSLWFCSSVSLKRRVLVLSDASSRSGKNDSPKRALEENLLFSAWVLVQVRDFKFGRRVFSPRWDARWSRPSKSSQSATVAGLAQAIMPSLSETVVVAGAKASSLSEISAGLHFIFLLSCGWLFILKIHELCEYACLIWVVWTEIGMLEVIMAWNC